MPNSAMSRSLAKPRVMECLVASYSLQFFFRLLLLLFFLRLLLLLLLFFFAVVVAAAAVLAEKEAEHPPLDRRRLSFWPQDRPLHQRGRLSSLTAKPDLLKRVSCNPLRRRATRQQTGLSPLSPLIGQSVTPPLPHSLPSLFTLIPTT
jgi:hypothetical protein